MGEYQKKVYILNQIAIMCISYLVITIFGRCGMKKAVCTLGYLGIIFYILYNAKVVFAGVKEGVDVVVYTLIPSLFIFMILTGILCSPHSPVAAILARPFSLFTKNLLNIEPSLFTVVLLSLIGGYPVGAKILDEYVVAKKISTQTAQKMLGYCVNCGPAFLITGVGVALFGNVTIGIFICISQILACLIIGVVSSFLYKSTPKDDLLIDSTNTVPSNVLTEKHSFSLTLVKSVNSSIRAMATLGGLVVLFCGITAPFVLFVSEHLGDFSAVIKGILEVTSGVLAINTSNLSHKIELICAATAFGGICVHLQVIALTTHIKFSYKRFLLLRIIYTAISVEFIKLFMNLFPQTLSCMTANTSIVTSVSSKSPYALILLCFLCFIYLCSLTKLKLSKAKN